MTYYGQPTVCHHCGISLKSDGRTWVRWSTRFCSGRCRTAHNRLAAAITRAQERLAELLKQTTSCED